MGKTLYGSIMNVNNDGVAEIIVVHPKNQPTDEDWQVGVDAIQETIKNHPVKLFNVLIFSDGGAPNAKQRNTTVSIYPEGNIKHEIKLLVVTQNFVFNLLDVICRGWRMVSAKELNFHVCSPNEALTNYEKYNFKTPIHVIREHLKIAQSSAHLDCTIQSAQPFLQTEEMNKVQKSRHFWQQ